MIFRFTRKSNEIILTKLLINNMFAYSTRAHAHKGQFLCLTNLPMRHSPIVYFYLQILCTIGSRTEFSGRNRTHWRYESVEWASDLDAILTNLDKVDKTDFSDVDVSGFQDRAKFTYMYLGLNFTQILFPDTFVVSFLPFSSYGQLAEIQVNFGP